MKKLINATDTVVTDALAGVAAAHPSLSVDVVNKIILRAGGPRQGDVAPSVIVADPALFAAPSSPPPPPPRAGR